MEMFAQLFGYYLLNNDIISREQLNEALVNKNIYKSKLGSLFTDAGYMTKEQAEYIHTEQKHFDKKFGDIAVFLGFLTRAQMEELVKRQEQDDMALYDALIAKGYITSSEHKNLLQTFRQELGLTDELSDKDLVRDLINIYELEGNEYKDIYADYVALFVRNAIRFVGDDFAFSSFNPEKEAFQECMVSQKIEGKLSLDVEVYGAVETFEEFSRRYSENIGANSVGIGDFLDLQNALYASNRFAADNLKVTLSSRISDTDRNITTEDKKVVIPLSFTFGKIYLCVIKK